MDHRDPRLLHGRPLPFVGPDAVGHESAVVPQAELGVGLPILGAVRVQLAHPLDLPVIFGEVGLDGKMTLPGGLAQPGHQLIRAGGGEPGGEHGADVGEAAAFRKPPLRLPDGFLRGLLQDPGGGVAVHVHLAHIAGDPRPLQLLHEDQRGIGVEGGEHGHPGGAVGNELRGQLAVDVPGVVRIGKPGLRREGVGVEPVQQRQVHAGAQHGILGGVEVQVCERLEDQAGAEILHRRAGIAFRQGGEDPGDDAVLRHQIAALRDLRRPGRGGGDDGALQNRCGHRDPSLSKILEKQKERPRTAARTLIAGPWAAP